MNTARTTVPRSAELVPRFIDDFIDAHGFPPLAGGEGTPGQPPAQTAPPLVTHTDPAALAAADAAGAPDPAAGGGEAQPPWVDTILNRMDAMGPPPAVDPAAVELGFVDPPPAGQPPQMQPPASPGQPRMQPGTQFPGQVDPQQQQVQQIQDWVNTLVAEQVQQAVSPQLQALRDRQRQEEIAGLRADIPAFNDPQQATEIVTRARQWAQMYFPNNPQAADELTREPAFLETVYHAGTSIEQARLAQAQQSPGAAPAVPGPNGYPIEQPGAAAPAAQTTPEQAAAQAIVNAGRGSGLQGSAFV